MCGRFTQNYTWAEVHAFLSVFGPPRNLRPRYNIAPTTSVDVVRTGEQGRELVSMRWGLVPFFWKKTLKELPATFNARAETVAEKPMFRDCFRKRRCIIPASGFFEWTGGKGSKQPHLFTAADGSPLLAFAGLWDRWQDPATGETGAFLHHHRLRRERVDGPVSRPDAGAAAAGGFRGVAGWHARPGSAQARVRKRAARMAGFPARQPRRRRRR